MDPEVEVVDRTIIRGEVVLRASSELSWHCTISGRCPHTFNGCSAALGSEGASLSGGNV